MKPLKYFNLKKHWAKQVVPHLKDRELNELLVRDFNRFTWGTWRRKFKPGDLPEQIESCDWRFDHRRPWPKYWAYVKHSACHWIANFSLRLAMLVEPSKEWRIVTSDGHSTVWDGDDTLFDFNFQALGITPVDCLKIAWTKGEMLPVGKYLKTYCPEHYTRSAA